MAASAAAVASGAARSTGDEEGGWGTQLERWVDGVPPVVDVTAADRSEPPSPVYVGVLVTDLRRANACALGLRRGLPIHLPATHVF